MTAEPALIRIVRPPVRSPDADRPFAEDTEHATYDPAAVTRYWQVLSQVNVVLEEFAGRFSGKTSPVHHFWHTFDLALTRGYESILDVLTALGANGYRAAVGWSPTATAP